MARPLGLCIREGKRWFPSNVGKNLSVGSSDKNRAKSSKTLPRDLRAASASGTPGCFIAILKAIASLRVDGLVKLPLLIRSESRLRTTIQFEQLVL